MALFKEVTMQKRKIDNCTRKGGDFLTSGSALMQLVSEARQKITFCPLTRMEIGGTRLCLKLESHAYIDFIQTLLLNAVHGVLSGIGDIGLNVFLTWLRMKKGKCILLLKIFYYHVSSPYWIFTVFIFEFSDEYYFRIIK